MVEVEDAGGIVDLLVVGRIAGVGNGGLLRVDDPGAVHAEIGGANIFLTQAGLDFPDLFFGVVFPPQRQIDIINRVQAGGLGRHHHGLFGVQKIDVLVLHDFTNAQGGGKVGYPEDQAGHAVRSGRNGVGVHNGLGNFDQGFDLHPRFPAGFLFQVIEQAGNVFDIVRPVGLGQDNAVKFIWRAFHDGFQVAQEKLGADIIGPHSNDFLAEIQGVERFDNALPTLWPFELVWAGVFKIHHHMVNRRFDRVGGIAVQLHAVAGIGHFSAGNDETGSLVNYEHTVLLYRSLFLSGGLSLYQIPAPRPTSLGGCLSWWYFLGTLPLYS